MTSEKGSTRRHLVVTGAKSRSHLIHISAYVRSLLAEQKLKGLKLSFIEAEAFLAAPAVKLADLQQMLPDDDRLELVDGMPGYAFDRQAKGEYVAVGAPSISMLAHLARANPGRRFAVVVTDEGLGTYGSVLTRCSALRRQGVSYPQALIKAGVIASVAKLTTTKRWAAYRKGADGWHVATPIAEEFRRHVAHARPGTKPQAIVLTQPFADLGLITESAHLAYVDALCDAARLAGLDPVIRPHPAEDTSKYADRVLMQTRGTAELDPLVVAASLVIGGPSTALINVSAMYKSRVVWVSAPGLEHLDTEVSSTQAGILRRFLGEPTMLDQLNEVVRSTVSGSRPLT